MFKYVNSQMRFLGHIVLMLFVVVGLSACSSSSSDEDITVSQAEVYDPLEGYNRFMFAINTAIDDVILEPAARGYRSAIPDGIRMAIRNFLRNLKSPLIIANNLLQGDWEGAGNATFRMVGNTFAGFGGLLDVAGWDGTPYEEEDFGQTLAVWGFGEGIYVMWPVLGPANTRDSFGFVVDTLADPIRMTLDDAEQDGLMYTRFGLGILDTRESLLDVLDDLERNSVDYYAAVRSIYNQRRNALIRDEYPDAVGAFEYPDFEDGYY